MFSSLWCNNCDVNTTMYEKGNRLSRNKTASQSNLFIIIKIKNKSLFAQNQHLYFTITI